MILVGVTLGVRFAEELARGFGPKRSVMRQYFAHAEGRGKELQQAIIRPANFYGVGFP